MKRLFYAVPKHSVAAVQRRTARVLTLLVAAASMQLAAAQAPQPVAAPDAAAQRGVLVGIEEEVAPNADGHNQTTIDENTLEQWALGGEKTAARNQYQAIIDLEINQIDGICGLSAEQKQLLKLAGAGEFQRALNDLTMLQARVAGFTYDQEEVNELYQTLQPIRNQVQRRPLDPQSLVNKLLPSVLDPEQAERLQQWRDARERVQQRRAVEAAIAMIERQIPLRDDQRQRLIELAQVEHGAGPFVLVHPGNRRAINAAPHPTAFIQRLNNVAPETFEEFLTDAQWDAMQAIFLPNYRNTWMELRRRSNEQTERVKKLNESDS